MDFELRRVYVLYAVGVLLGIITVFYFAFLLLDDLSPTVTAMLLVLGFVFFGAAGLFTRAHRLDLVYYVLGAAAYLIGIWYTITRFDLGDVGVLLVLAVSSILFIGLGYLSYEGYLDVERRAAGVLMVGVLGVGVLLIGADLLGPQPTTEMEFEEEVEIPELGDEVRIGTVTVHNEFVLSRTVDGPDLHACLYAPDREPAPLRFEERLRGDVLSGGESRSLDIYLRSEAFFDRDDETLLDPLQDRDTIPVERADECPDQVDDVQLIVVEGPRQTPAPPR